MPTHRGVVTQPFIFGFLKVRNEIIREGNLYRVLKNLDTICDGGVVFDDHSCDGTTDVLRDWACSRGWIFLRNIGAVDWENELEIKQLMMNSIHELSPEKRPQWVLWMDGDEEIPNPEQFKNWVQDVASKSPHLVWGIPYTQLWRNAGWARTDSGFDGAVFFKLWKYFPDLRFDVQKKLHHAQFPIKLLEEIMQKRVGVAPFEVIHWGNFGKNLVWKCISYARYQESILRHMHFEDATYRPVMTNPGPSPAPFSDHEKKLILQMKELSGLHDLITVIVPTYNRGKYLPRTLDSVLKQTDQRWICVVLDDGSTDDTQEIMRAYQDRDPRMFYCRYEQNRGGVAMNEIGMTIACEVGAIWVRLGSDDYFYPHKLETDRVALRKCDACYGPYRDLHESGEKDLRNLPIDARGVLLSEGFAASWANIAVKTSVLKEVRARFGGFCDLRIRNMEDWLVNARIATVTDIVWRGLRKDGQVVMHCRTPQEIPDGPEFLEHDAVWHIAADGASNKPDIISHDAKQTRGTLRDDLTKFAPKEREKQPEIKLYPLRGK